MLKNGKHPLLARLSVGLLGAIILLIIVTPAYRSSEAVAGVPRLENGAAAPGKMVREVSAAYQAAGNSNIFHTVYLPTNWRAGRTYPVIVEYVPNYWRNKLDGTQNEAQMGYAISQGRDYIWIVMPTIDDRGTSTLSDDLYQPEWWGKDKKDPKATIQYVKDNLQTILRTHGGDPNNVILVGFSRGAIATNYIGLADNEIAQYWSAFYGHDHYDGVTTTWGYPGDDASSAKGRLARLDGRPQLMSYNAGFATAAEVYPYLKRQVPSGDNFTFLPIPDKVFKDTQVSGGSHYHHVDWMYRNNQYITEVRKWFYAVTSNPRQILPVSAQASSEYGGFKAEHVIDGNNNAAGSRWISAYGDTKPWIILEFSTNYKVSHFEMWTGWRGYNYPFNAYEIEYWDSGSDSWKSLYQKSNPSASESVTFYGVQQKTTSRLRIKADGRARVYEIRVKGDPLIYPYGRNGHPGDYAGNQNCQEYKYFDLMKRYGCQTDGSGSTTTPPTVTVPSPTATPNPSPGGGSSGPIESGKTYYIKSKASGKCVDVPPPADQNGTNIHLWDCSPTLNRQQWLFEATGDGFFKISSVASSKVIDTTIPADVNGTNIQIWGWANNLRQQWKPVPVGDGSYRLELRNGHWKTMTVSGTENGSNIAIWGIKPDGLDRQHWYIEPVR